MKRMRSYLYAGITALFAYAAPLTAGSCSQNCCSGFTGSVEYLYWQVSQDQMAYALDTPGGLQALINAIASAPPLILDLDVTTHEPKFKWQSGLRLGAGYNLPCSGWGLSLFWTHLNQHTRASVFDPTEGIIPITMPGTTLIGIASTVNPRLITEATSNWKFNLNALDLQLAKTWCACSDLTFRHFIGLKAASIRQTQNTEYFGFTVSSLPAIALNKKTNNFQGIGPSIGLDSAWEFAPSWSISSGVSGALLYGKFNSSIDADVIALPNDVHTHFNQNRQSRIRPMIDAYLGIDWTTELGRSCALSVAFLYELQYWWNQWQPTAADVAAIINGSNSPQGDLMMQGLTARVSFAF